MKARLAFLQWIDNAPAINKLKLPIKLWNTIEEAYVAGWKAALENINCELCNKE